MMTSASHPRYSLRTVRYFAIRLFAQPEIKDGAAS
jgi:hypothetical protein